MMSSSPTASPAKKVKKKEDSRVDDKPTGDDESMDFTGGKCNPAIDGGPEKEDFSSGDGKDMCGNGPWTHTKGRRAPDSPAASPPVQLESDVMEVVRKPGQSPATRTPQQALQLRDSSPVSVSANTTLAVVVAAANGAPAAATATVTTAVKRVAFLLSTAFLWE